MKTIVLLIKTCKHCPYLCKEKDMGTSVCWYCTVSAPKKIAGYIEWSRDEPKVIPSWCPLEDVHVKIGS